MSAEVWLKSSMQGDRLELAAAGHWTADNAAEIEKLILQLTPLRHALSTLHRMSQR